MLKIHDSDSSRVYIPMGFGLAFLVGALLYQLVSAFQSIQFLNQQVIVLDDAYYYFQVARNFVLRGWATFDGLHATSGIQLLWGLILFGVAGVFTERIAFLHAALALSALMNGGAGVLLWRFARKLYSPALGELAVMIWAGFMLGLRPTMMGMEYPLHITVIVVLFFIAWDLFAHPQNASLGKIAALGMFAAFNFGTRLDSGVYSALLIALVLLVLLRARVERSFLLKALVVLGAILGVSVCLFAALNYSFAGTLMPLSGLVKSFYAAHHFDAYGWTTALAGHVFWFVEIQARAILDVVASILLEGEVYEPLALIVILGMLGASVWGARRIYVTRAQNPERFRFAQFLGLLWLFGVVHVVTVVGTIGHFAHITQHYWGWLFITWCLWAAVLVEMALDGIQNARVRRSVAAIGLAAFLGAHLWFAVAYYIQPFVPNLNNRRVETAAWINAHLPPDARIGAWNAGVLGYFSDRTVVNLDGLANDREYLQFLASGAPLQVYLQQQQIHYIVDVDAQDLSMPYQAAWDHVQLFRNVLPWSQLDILMQDNKVALYVLRLQVESASK
jgi:hypothetical protein